MPGYDGLEFISRTREINPDIQFVIISGYQQFEYAQKAIKYGVIDYLLKPIKKNELFATLTKIKNQYLERVDLLTKEEQSELSIRNNINKLRTRLFSAVLFYNRTKDITIDSVNNDYGYKFKEGLFQIIIVKLDGVGRSYSTTVTFLEEKILKIIQNNLNEYCYDLEKYFENNIIYCIINYNPNNKKNVRRKCKILMDELLLQKEIFESLEVTMGLGTVENDIHMIDNSYKAAILAYEQRLVLGTNRVIEGAITTSNNLVESSLFHDFNKDMKAALERLDKEAVTSAIHYIREGLRNRPETSGHELLQMTKEICNLFLFTMHYNKFPVDGGDNFLENFSMNVNDIGSVYKLYQYLTDVIVNSMDKIIEDKRQSDTRPIRDAKQFIQTNYKRQITLEEVSGKVGFNATYFSSLFKKETGYTFLEYLSEIRINKAKELMKLYDENMEKIYPVVLDDLCPECGSNLVIRRGRFGEFVACGAFPKCRYIRKEEKDPPKSTGIKCTNCEVGMIVERVSKRGRSSGKTFYACDQYPNCKTTYTTIEDIAESTNKA